MGVMLDNNHLQGLLEADISGKTSINLMRVGSEVSLGDTIVTSNLSHIFPPYYPVGTISAIRQTLDSINITAEVEPFSRLNELTSVIVLFYEHKENYEEELEIKDGTEY
jgi:rod shape-determining protein MreC